MIRPLLLTAALAIGIYVPVASNPLRVIDGDTVAIGSDRYRLATHDAPELFSPRCPAELALAKRAKARLEQLLAGDFSMVHVPCTYRPLGERNRDRHGRQCVVVRVPPHWENVGDVLIREKLAVAFSRGQKPDWCNAR